jgi:uncharacterized protein YbbC (DUF1343 family)/CubicO group peptidase (beta-lactamase class C family)
MTEPVCRLAPPLRALFRLACAFLLLFSLPQTQATTLRTNKLTELDAAIVDAIAGQKCPGGVLLLDHVGATYLKAFGQRAVEPQAEPMSADTIFDAASLTKVVAATPAIMLLVERGQVDLDAPVARYLPEFAANGKAAITVRQLLTHTSGLRPGIPARPAWSGYDKGIELACAEKPATEPGTAFRYSDINFITLGEIVRRVSKAPLNEFVAKEIYAPLKMMDTGFLPPPEKLARIAPTEKLDNGEVLRGVVHDPTSRRMGGVAGHAGLFFTAADLARYARMLLNLGELEGVRIFKPETVRLMTSVHTPTNLVRRGLGWDIDSGYSGPRGKLFPLGSYGHTGWTGTSLWIDPFSQSFVIFLSNRNHPTEQGNVIALRSRLGTLAAEAVADFNFTAVPGALEPRGDATASSTNVVSAKVLSQARVLNGIDVLVKDNFAPLKGKRIGLITNHTGHDRERNPTIDLLKSAPEVKLVALFSPEHGIRGAVDEKFSDSRDEKTGLPVYSLYGEGRDSRKPRADHLNDLDALVFDIQDIGCRFYTYPSTMGLAIEAAAENGRQIFVLDRVNPITGRMIDGPVLAEPPTFVGFYQVPLRHGLTVGELARMYNAEKNLRANLTVIQLEGWTRDMWFDQTGLPWTNPSPNMRSLAQATLYPGVGLLESALSVGRGTDTPFEVVGAPYIEDTRLADELNQAGLPGVRFVPVQFTPAYSVHKGKLCRGVNIIVTDRDACDVVDVGLLITRTLHRWYPKDFDLDKIKHLLLHASTLAALKADKPLGEIRATWRIANVEFQERRERFLIYR